MNSAQALPDSQIERYEQLDHLALDIALPWQDQVEQQEKFKRLLQKIGIPFLAFMIVMSFMSFFQEEEVEEKIVAKVYLDEIPQPPEPPPAPPPEQRTQNINKSAVPKPGAKTGAQDIASLAKQLSALRNSVNASQSQKKNVFKSDAGKVQKSSRAMLGKSSINSRSTGLKASDISVNAKGASLAEHKSDQVNSPIANIEIPTSEQYHYDPKKNSKRDMQSIRRNIERYKGTVYSLYSKALRLNPELGGRFVFKFVVLPDGSITELKLVSSELGDSKLEKQMLGKLKQLNLGAEDVNATAVQYTFNFLPS